MTDKRKMDILFEVIEFARKESQRRFYDWKDADDWMFSNLSITKREAEEIYADRDVMLYGASFHPE